MAGTAPTDLHFSRNAQRGAGPLQRVVIPRPVGRRAKRTFILKTGSESSVRTIVEISSLVKAVFAEQPLIKLTDRAKR